MPWEISRLYCHNTSEELEEHGGKDGTERFNDWLQENPEYEPFGVSEILQPSKSITQVFYVKRKVPKRSTDEPRRDRAIQLD